MPEHHGRMRFSLAIAFFLCLFLSSSPPAQAQETGAARAFSHEWLREHARELASQPHRAAATAEGADSLSYDEHRRINFDPEAAIWGGETRPFHLQMFHPGFVHTTPVGIHLVEQGNATRLDFAPDLFQYRGTRIADEHRDSQGFAGFRVHHPINTADYHDEFLVFLGASYFRAVARGNVYGLSARGLAINTVGPGEEEFPVFRDFWIEQPDDAAQAIVIHALLDSPSMTGAYRFTATPGEQTVIDVDATLYPRQDSAYLGIAPLTSMFFFDSSNRAGFDDYRAAVHDSNGLQMQQSDGEKIWRPLANPSRVQVSAFGNSNEAPAGFGLMQRAQAYGDFNDSEAHYHRRPSLWVEPLADWGAGRIELLEIPTSDEYQDNIAVYWQPEAALEAGRDYRFRYRMYWGNGTGFTPRQGWVSATSAGAATGSEERLFVIDYGGAAQIPDIESRQEAIQIRATTSAGDITDISGALVRDTGHYRAFIKLDPGDADLAELRVLLEFDGQQWGETWLYRWTR